MYGLRGHIKKDHRQSVNEFLISNPISTEIPQQQAGYQRPDIPIIHFTRINMSLSQALQHLLKTNLVTLCDPPSNPNISSPKYNPNAKCVYHSNSPGHDTDHCWVLKSKIQDLVDNKTIEFDPLTDFQCDHCAHA